MSDGELEAKRDFLDGQMKIFVSYTPLKTNMAGWNITIFNRRYINSFMVSIFHCHASRGYIRIIVCIATSHDLGPQKVAEVSGIPLIPGKSNLVKYQIKIWPDILYACLYLFVKCIQYNMSFLFVQICVYTLHTVYVYVEM